LFEKGYEGTLGLYRDSLGWALKHRIVVLIVFFLTAGLTGVLYFYVPKDFLPPGDTGQLIAFTEGGQDSSFAAMAARQIEVAEIIAKDPDIAAVNSSVGAGGPRATSNAGTMFLRLKPHAERKSKPAEIVARLRGKVASVPGIRVSLQNPPPIRIGGQLTNAQYQYTLQGSDLEELYTWSNQFLQRFRKIEGLQDVTSNLYNNSPTVTLDIDREKLPQLGLTVSQVQEALTSSFSTRQVSTIYGSTAQYQVIMEVAPEFQNDPTALSKIYVRSSQGGKLVPLDAVARITRKNQALTINHQGQLPSVTISFNLSQGVALGDAVDRIRAAERELRMPVSLNGAFQGTAQAFQDSLKGLGVLLIVAVLVIYIVLGILYESFIHPLTILSGLPSAGLGALLTLYLFNLDLSLYAFVGVIMLIGIVKKNAIMMIDFAIEKERTDGTGAEQAIYEACLIRFRPIMMTTMAALAGTLPIAIGYGAGAERVPLGMAVVGGLIVSQFLTLYLTPVIYVYMDMMVRRFSGKAVKPAASAEVAAA
jgi:HAE1 family hydrophobic/amphiphilic exporter-1